MSTEITYSSEWLQVERPQPMYDKKINRLYKSIFFENPADNHQLIPEFKTAFTEWLEGDRLNQITGYRSGWLLDVCIGCTHYIDDLYQVVGRDRLMTFENDYKYHWRLNPQIQYTTLETLTPGKELLISMPFPFVGDVHPQMDEILNRCLKLQIPVHIDGAWLGCMRGIQFDFSHPAIHSFAISLSKALGTGANRIGLRFTKERRQGPITIMNDFNMNCDSLIHIGTRFMKALGPNYFWLNYGDAYEKICKDFGLTPTKAIHLAKRDGGPVGIRPLLRYLNDR